MTHYLMGKQPRYVAKVMLVVFTARGEEYLRAGRLLPADADDRHIDHLLALDMIEEVR